MISDRLRNSYSLFSVPCSFYYAESFIEYKDKALEDKVLFYKLLDNDIVTMLRRYFIQQKSCATSRNNRIGNAFTITEDKTDYSMKLRPNLT